MVEELAQADDAVAACVDDAAWALADDELVAALDAAHRLEQRLAAVTLALVREVDGRGTARAQGASSTAVWLRERLRLTVPAARRLVDLAAALDTGNPGIRQALADGAISLDQARVIADTVATVHTSAGAEAADKAVGVLVDWAGQFDPDPAAQTRHPHPRPRRPRHRRRRRPGRTDADARRASRDRHVTMSDADRRPTPTHRHPRQRNRRPAARRDRPADRPSGPDDQRCAGQRRHDALADLCRLSLRTGELPEHGGDPAQIVVTTSYDALAGQLGAGTLDTGLHLTPETVRRLACDAAILPAVLDGTGQALDLGRQRRLITGPLRRALVLRDRGCAFPGCDRPPRWCDAHHIHHWADGGDTNLDNAVLLCGHHHRHLHHNDWTVRLAGDGYPEFVPPAWLDPDQLPRRNHYHRRT